jgi:hypothetical protein
MQSDTLGKFIRLIEVVTPHRLTDIRPQLVPSVALGNNTLRQTFGAVAAVCLLGDLEYKFVHNLRVENRSGSGKTS